MSGICTKFPFSVNTFGDNSVNMGMPVGEVTERMRRAHYGRNTTISV